LNDEHVTRTVVATTRGCVPAMQEKLQDKGAQVLVLPGPGGRVSLGRLLVRLGKRGALHVLCEGGGEMAAAMLRAKLVDEVWMFVAPCVIGGREAVPAFGGFGWSLSGAPKLKFISFERVGDDVLIRGRPV
jgi:diaminohydroxyphosphoribosylaminopyrimidine deaminase/5-amino-6-(5-phosphoribosylamino)uracil reductase